MTDTAGSDNREDLNRAASLLQSVSTRLEQSAAQRRQEILDRAKQPKAGRDLAECQDLVHTASAYATVARDLADLGQVEAAETAVSVGLAYVDAAQECLDAL
jgi:hypothetical protein